MDLYVAASRVDEYRRVLTTDYATEDGLIQSIKQRFVPRWQMKWGTALHACIEDPARWRTAAGYTYKDERTGESITWPASVVEQCVAAWPVPCIFERKNPTLTFDVGGDQVTVAGRTDATHGLVIVEGKTKFGWLDFDEYAESLQWRFYLLANPWASCVQYRIHEIGGMYEREGQLCIAKGGPRLDGIHVLTMWRQDRLEAELRSWVERFVAWAKSRGLDDRLVRYQR